mmetsp:Transcript_20848/g.35605  ORF Transcript_20848/g.35605 Transcript_20848/m.35605 type:complete len:142 (+) Transcript_20848:196-621(+)
MIKRSTSIETSLPSQQRLELKLSHELLNSELPERTPRMDTVVDKPERRGAIIISSNRSINSSSEDSTMSDSIVKQLANMDITSQKRKNVSSYRTLLKKRAHSRRKNRVVIIDSKVTKNLSCESSSCCESFSCVQVEPITLR